MTRTPEYMCVSASTRVCVLSTGTLLSVLVLVLARRVAQCRMRQTLSMRMAKYII
jgi:hypothetical protein